MASFFRKPRSPYWFAAYSDANGADLGDMPWLSLHFCFHSAIARPLTLARGIGLEPSSKDDAII
jgi:hypothetical protein